MEILEGDPSDCCYCLVDDDAVVSWEKNKIPFGEYLFASRVINLLPLGQPEEEDLPTDGCFP